MVGSELGALEKLKVGSADGVLVASFDGMLLGSDDRTLVGSADGILLGSVLGSTTEPDAGPVKVGPGVPSAMANCGEVDINEEDVSEEISPLPTGPTS